MRIVKNAVGQGGSLKGMAHLDLGWAVRGVDSLLRMRQGIEEFTDDAECVLRISMNSAGRSLQLSDGTFVREGGPVLQLHLWNERLPVLPATGPNAVWANSLKRRMRRSLTILAYHLHGEGRFEAVEAIQAAPAFPSRLGPVQMARIAGHFGFDVVDMTSGRGVIGQIHTLFDSLLVWSLTLAFNPAGLSGKGLLRHRCQIWMSRRKLENHYGTSADIEAVRGVSGVS
jgi:hypothetical protein